MNVKVNVTTKIAAEITERELVYAIFQYIANRFYGGELPDDAGCDWHTDGNGNTCIAGDKKWQVSDDPQVAALVDAANIIGHDRALKMEA